MRSKKQRFLKRVLAVFLSFVMVISMVQRNAYAAGTADEENFTICVKDSSGLPVSDATVSYEIFNEETSLVTGSTITDEDGYAVISEMASYETEIGNGTVTLSYNVSKDGYEVQEATSVVVSDVKGNIDITLLEEAASELTVSVHKTGSGVVKINGNESTLVTVAPNEQIGIEIQAIDKNEGTTYIKALTIGEEKVELEGDSTYYQDDALVITDNTDIYVEFVTRYTVTANAEAGGKITLDGNSNNSVTVDENGEVNLEVIANSNYQITGVFINGNSETVTDPYSFSKKVTVTANTVISATFAREYKVEVQYDATNGVVVTNPASTGGKVVVKEGSNVTITATPNANYRVSIVKINGIEKEIFNENNKTYETTINSLKEDYTYEIVFAPNKYSITVKPTEQGNVEIDYEEVNHGGSCNVYITPKENYNFEDLKINGESVEINDELSDTRVYVIKNITKDIMIEAIFTVITIGDIDDVSYNKNDAVRKVENQNSWLYVFSNTTKVTFKTDKLGIKVYYPVPYPPYVAYYGESGCNEVSLDKSIHITRIEVAKIQGKRIRWYETPIPKDGIKIVIDKKAPTLELTPDDNSYEFYNKDVKVTIKAEDPDDYSGIDKVEYWVYANGQETQQGEFSGGNKNTFQKDIIVDSSLNNYDNVTVKVRVTDAAKNVTERQIPLKISTAKPIVNIEMDGKKEDDAVIGYYNKPRTATITIIEERDSTFNETNAKAGVKITAKDSSGREVPINSNMQWKSKGQGIHEATITFNKDANYEWSFSYTNKAGLSYEAINETGEYLYKFTIDQKAPTGELVYDDNNKWNSLLELLTFGLFKNSEVSIGATVQDDTSPLYDVKYYKSDELLDYTQLDQIADDKFVKEKYTVKTDEQFIIYAKIKDYAGNTTYISTKGIIVDKTKSVIEFVCAEKEIYNDDVQVGLIVTDGLDENKAYSGIKSIKYLVMKEKEEIVDEKPDEEVGGDNEEVGDNEEEVGDEEEKEKEIKVGDEIEGFVVTQTGTLYEFDIPTPTKEQLCREWNSKDTGKYIKIKKESNNADNIALKVIVEDNAGNKVEEYRYFNINIDKPKVEISVDNIEDDNDTEENDNGTEYNGNGYFKGKMVATITVEDRASAFDKQAATDAIKITAVDGNNEEIELNRKAMITDWEDDGDKHKAKIIFDQDANYKWSFDYTNKAGNEMEEPVLSGLGLFEFTIDNTPPTGKVIIGEKTWKVLISVLTFGLWTKGEFEVEATAEDATSSCEIEYYKINKPVELTIQDLEKEGEFQKYYEKLVFDRDELFVVYFRITDSAGNCTYISSDGAIVDKQPSEISFEVKTPGVTMGNSTVFNQNVEIDVKVTDSEPSSGIAKVEYWVEKDGVKTQEDKLFTFNNSNPKYSDLERSCGGTIIVDAQKNNSSNVKVYVIAVDNAGNESKKSISLDIDVTKPSISITYDNNKDNNGNGYFNAKRTATVVIKERTNHFDGQKAKEGITITAVDAKGNPVAINTEGMISKWTTVEGATPDDATHTAKINFGTDANYKLSIKYTDNAGNKNEKINTGSSVAPFDFTVDTVAPNGTITATSEEGRVTTWDGLVRSLTFGFWSNKGITITSTAEDRTSQIASVSYYKTNKVTALTEDQLKNITDWKEFKTLTVKPNEQFTIYLKIVDKAGNTTYVSTDGMITDNAQPREEVFAPAITATPQQQTSDIYNGDVDVTVEVDEPMVNGTYSGLKTITYKVFNMGKETQSGTLYSMKNNAPTHSELLKHWTGKITVDSRLNNSNDVVVEIYAQDNALNSSSNKITIKIDTTAPTVHIRYNNNNPDSDKYYKENRVATIVVTERNFDPKGVKINITNTDGTVPTISNWTKVEGTGNLDNTTHTATITYEADGDYTFEMECLDLASNLTTDETFEAGTVNAKEFTIDKTLPQISVSYDNNNAQNGKYFNNHRVATVTVREHNFDASRVQFTQTASIEGGTVVAPSPSWNSNGDVHTATITYNVDGDYTFDVKMIDMAGNESGEVDYGSSVAAKEFTIDTEIAEPEITGVENGVAYKGDVIPAINFSDINYNNYEVKLLRTRLDEINVDVTERYIKGLNESNQGGAGTFDLFDKVQDNDGIYTLYAKVTDKAGNKKEKNVTFTLNRFGSVYAYSEYLVSLIKDSGAYVQNLTDNLVITEYNPDRLVENSLSIEVTHDGRPMDNVKFKVSPEVNDKVAVGSSGWYQYQYVIDKDNFSKDGVYKVSISSKDETGNTPDNNNYKDKNILFRVDTTAPELTSVVGLEKTVINSQEAPVKYTVYDTIGLKSVTVYINGKQYGDVITEFDDINNYAGTFSIAESTEEQKVRLVIEDLAGNVTDTDSEDFSSVYDFEKSVLVTTNFFVRWYANKPLFWGSIGSVPVASAGAWAGITLRKRSNLRIRRKETGM